MRVLVTGGAGSIGSAVVADMLERGHDVIAVDRNEEALWELSLQHADADCRCADIVTYRGRERVNVVVHCAALKHVRWCEQNPDLAHYVNVEGTRAVLGLPADRVVLISTDKAIKPVSMLGGTKAEAERLVSADARGCVVRFGNVLGSRGSVVPAVVRCRELGIPVRMTDPEMTRWLCTIREAVELIRWAVGDVHMRLMHPMHLRSARVGDLISVCTSLFAPGRRVVTSSPGLGERTDEPMMDGDNLVWSNDLRYLMSHDDLYGFVLNTVGGLAHAIA